VENEGPKYMEPIEEELISVEQQTGEWKRPMFHRGCIIKRAFFKIKSLISSLYFDYFGNFGGSMTEEEEFNSWMEDSEPEILVLVRQEIMSAKDVPLDEGVDFPWHGRPESDFVALNEKLNAAIEDLPKCKTKADKMRFRRKHKDVFNEYFQRPIMIYDEDGTLNFGFDGRHRIYTAKKYNSFIPIFIVKYILKDGLSYEEYKKIDPWQTWDFGC